MARYEIKFAELHTPLFLSGTNHGVKLHNGSKGMQLIYDDVKDMLYVFYMGSVALIKSYASISPSKMSDVGVDSPKAQAEPMAVNPDPTPRGKVKAQVSGPQDHVFQGPGAGKARD